MRSDIPPSERCEECDGWGWVMISFDPDRDINCPCCQGTGKRDNYEHS